MSVPRNLVLEEKQITDALIDRNLYNPQNPYHDPPDIKLVDNKQYPYEINCTKWNSRSIRASVYRARLKKCKWIISATKKGHPRISHY